MFIVPEDADAAAMSALVPLRPPAIICAASDSALLTACAPSSTGRKKMARTSPRHFILRLSIMATNREKKIISGTSMTMLPMEVVSVCLKDAWEKNAS